MLTIKTRTFHISLGTGLLLATALGSLFAQAPPQRQAAAQAKLEKEVRHVLVTLPYYSVFDNLAYGVDGDRVSLTGQVVRPTTKTDAEKSVKSIEGVSAVDNQIEVLPTSPNDDRLRRAEFRAIYSASNLQRYAIQAVPPIHIIVKNGNVTLVGAVANQADKTIAEMRANSVPGVFSVKDELATDK
jgi:hyperosmotically inducible protein